MREPFESIVETVRHGSSVSCRCLKSECIRQGLTTVLHLRGGAEALERARHSKLENDDFMSLCLWVSHYRSPSDEQYVSSWLAKYLHKMLMLTLMPLGSKCIYIGIQTICLPDAANQDGFFARDTLHQD